MAVKRQSRRHIVKIPAELSFSGRMVRGTTVRISEKGFFVRSQTSFPVGTPVEIALHLEDGGTCNLKGIIKYMRNFNIMMRDNGMGIELTEKDERYQEFIRTVEEERG
jgi:hypothetical protein